MDQHDHPGTPADTHSYKGWLNSDRWWKRALGVVGYSFLGNLVVSLAVMLPVFVLVLLALALRW